MFKSLMENKQKNKDMREEISIETSTEVSDEISMDDFSEEVEKPKQTITRTRKPRATRKKKELNYVKIEREFLLWLSTLNIDEYPNVRAILVRFQKLKRPSFIKDSIKLFWEYLRDNNYI